MSFGLSTAWNAFRHKQARQLIFEIKELGFGEVELSFNLTPAMVDDIAQLTGEGEIKVVSVHNYCPIPDGLFRQQALPDYYSLASQDEAERQLAIRFTKKSIDTARLLGAGILVLHAGRVEIPDRTSELIRIYSAAGKDTKEFIALRDSMIKQRQDHAARFFEKTLQSLEEIDCYAREHDLYVGIETRFYYREIPSFEEFIMLWEKFPGSHLLYWHDTGHAQIREYLGFERHRDYLESFGSYLIGAHLHDITGCQDHKAPFTGELDFSWLKPYIGKQGVIKIIEAHHPASGKDIMQGRDKLQAMLA